MAYKIADEDDSDIAFIEVFEATYRDIMYDVHYTVKAERMSEIVEENITISRVYNCKNCVDLQLDSPQSKRVIRDCMEDLLSDVRVESEELGLT